MKYSNLILSILFCLGAGVIGSFFTFSAIPTWYVYLDKPTFSPPDWIFGPVWTTLYILMGISLSKVLISENKKRKKAVRIFMLQLMLNIAWSIFFFGFKNMTLGFVDIILLLLTIIWTTKVFYQISKPASYLLIPYIVWVSFAAVLNFSIMILN